jgi:glycosyltransferase involved in cell wall biosynthesis
MKIDLLCNDGSPLGVIPSHVYGRGVGGAELAMLTWATTMAGRGHAVRVFNDPCDAGVHDGTEFLPVAAFSPREGNRDALITYRSPNRYKGARAGVKIHWSMDQWTVGDYRTDVVPFVDRIVCISPYHVQDYSLRYGKQGDKIGYLDLGVKLADYAAEDVERVPGQCIYCSMPDRGLRNLHTLWKQILELEPGASLVITGDFTLWGAANPGNQQHRLQWLHTPNVRFVGNIDRRSLVREQLASQVHAYPCTYKELFCIASAECQVAGAVSITPPSGALETTNEFGYLLRGNVLTSRWQRLFVEAVVAGLRLTDAERSEMQRRAKARFDWEVICSQWETLLEAGRFPDGQQGD